MALSTISAASPERPDPVRDNPDVFVSYAREDREFVEGRLMAALLAHDKQFWIDVEDIRGGASDWRASVWAGIESAKVVVFVLTPDSLASEVCGDELRRADELNKRIIPVLRRSVDGLPVPPTLARPNWIVAREEEDFDTSIASLIEALELDEPWVERHARLTQRTGEWLRHDRDGSYLLRGSDLRDAERWLDDQAAHREAPTADQITYITASRRAAARRQRALLSGVGLALVVTAVLALAALVQWRKAVERERTASAQAWAAQSIAALSRDPEASVRDALQSVATRPDLPEAKYALRRAVSLAGWNRLLRLRGGRDVPLLDVEFSEDGTRVATAGSDRRVAVWDTQTGRRITLVRTGGATHTVQFSPDGRQLLTASDGGVAQIWDSSTGRSMQKLDTKSDVAWFATWGAEGRRILTATAAGGALWNASDGRAILELRNVGGLRGTIRMSLDGRRALTAGSNGAARLWNLVTGKRTTLPGPNKTYPLVFALLSADGRRFATFYADGAFCVWDDGRLKPRTCVPPVIANGLNSSNANDVDLSRDGRRVLRVGSNNVVEVWDAASRDRRPIARFDSGGPVSSAQFDRNGDYVVTGRDDGFGQVWRVKPTRRVALLRGHTRGVRRARFSPDGRQVATVSDDGSARLWATRPRTPIDAHWRSADSTSFGPNSRDVLVVRGTRRGIWNTSTGKVVELRGGAGRDVVDPTSWPCGRVVGCAPWSRKGLFVAGANASGRAVIWSARTGHVVKTVGNAPGPVVEVAFSPDGSRVVVVDGSRPRAQIWGVSPLEPRERVPRRAADQPLVAAQFVEDPLRVLTVDADGRVRLSNPATGEAVPLRGATLPAAVSASSDGRRVAVGTSDGWLRVFSHGGRADLAKKATDGVVTSLAFSPRGGVIATGGQRGTAITWDGRKLARTPLRAFGGRISGTTFSPGGGLLLVTSENKARLWDRTLRRVVLDLPSTHDVRAEFSPDGSRIVIAGKTRLEVLPCVACLPLKELEQRARSLLPAP